MEQRKILAHSFLLYFLMNIIIPIKLTLTSLPPVTIILTAFSLVLKI